MCAGVKSLLALRGDAPKGNPNALAEGELKTALDLVELAREASSLEVGVAAFPEGHPESPNLEHDSKVLGLKQAAGAAYSITQLFFSLDAFVALRASADAAGATLPILPGLMPINNAKQVIRMAAMSGATIPADLLTRLEASDEAEARKIGMDFTIQLGLQLLEAGAPGLHIFTLNHSAAALELARGIGLCD
jgi:methylenetetrahydrofolate reductase (NADPH)